HHRYYRRRQLLECGVDEFGIGPRDGGAGHHAGDQPDVCPFLCLLCCGGRTPDADFAGAELNYPRVQPHLMIVIHSLGGGGAERVTVEMCAYWLEQGCRVTLVTQSGPETDAYPVPEGVDRRALGLAGESGGKISAAWSNLRRVWALRRLIRRLRPNVVLGMMTTSSVLAVLASHRLPCRVIATEHTHPPSQSLAAMWLRLRR